jgi:hypothetical protein
MAHIDDVQYAVTVTAATSANGGGPKAGTMQVHLQLGVDRSAVGGEAQERLNLALSLPQFYTLLSTLEEAKMALHSANPDR